MRELADRLPCRIVLAETFGWSSDAMEAQAFAYLAVRRLKKPADHLPDDDRRRKTFAGRDPGGSGSLFP